jgi:O-antigen ligase
MKKILKYKKELISLFSIILFFLIARKGKERYIFDIFFIISTLFLIKIKDIKLNKYLIFSLLGYITIVSFNFFYTRIVGIEEFLNYILYSYITFLILSQVELKEKIYKNYLFIFSIFTLIFTLKSVSIWYETGFKAGYRNFEQGIPTVTSIEVGVYVLICFISSIYSKEIFKKIISFVCFFISILSLVSINSRSSLMTIPVVITVIIIVKYYNKIKLKYLGIILLIVAISFHQIQKTNIEKYFYRVERTLNIENLKKEARIEIWKNGIEKFKENNYKSLGYKYFEKNKINNSHPHLHNIFLEILVTQGWLSLIFYILFNIFLLKEMIKKIRITDIESQKIMNYLTVSILIFYNLSGLVDANIYFKKVNLLVYFLYALALCSVEKEEKII